MQNNNFRHDINGLRAIAVIAVVLFHFNSSWMPGGFAGVDVFFVISGFLMTGIIFRGIEQENFSILKFYVARANRIIPALAVLCLVLLIFGWFYLTPLEYKALGKHAASSVAFLSNIIYWRESGYFDAASHEKWLLHTWSLSVEWQFYIIYPLVLVAMRKFMSIKTMKFLLLVGTVLGFIFCVIATYKWPNPSYYLLPTRAWEMMLGGIAYLYPLRLQENRKKLFEWTGLALIFGSYFLISSENLWPGYLAIFPVLGSFLLIQANRNNSIVTNNFIFQKLGTWSYSIYLWHWPIVVALYYFSRNGLFLYLGLSISIVLGVLSYKFIEQKNIINFFKKSDHKKIIYISLIGILIILTYMNIKPNKLGKIPENILKTIERGNYECFDKPQQHLKNSDFCKISEGNIKLFSFGDSHSYSLLPAIENIAKRNKLELTYTGYSGCPPLINIYTYRKDQNEKNCYELNNKVISYIKENNIKNVILSSRWSYYTEGNYSGSDIQYIYNNDKQDINQETSINSFKLGLNNTFKEYSKANVHVYIILQIPLQEKNPDQILYRSIINNNLNILEIEKRSISLENHNKFQRKTNEIILEEAKSFDNVTIIDPTPIMCNETHCPIGNKNESYYFDDDHLSIAGSLKLKNLIEKNILK